MLIRLVLGIVDMLICLVGVTIFIGGIVIAQKLLGLSKGSTEDDNHNHGSHIN